MKKNVILVNIIILIVLLLLTEFGVRFFTSENIPFEKRKEENVLYSPSGYIAKWLNENQKIYASVNGKILHDKLKFSINKQGYRDTQDINSNDTNEIRIAILGGSHVFDLNSFEYEGNPGFPELTEANLKAAGINCRVINAGVPGAETRDFNLKVINALSHYNVDYVVINSTWNDIKWIVSLTDTTLINKQPPQAFEKNPLIEKVNAYDKALGWSVIYRKLRDNYWKKKLGVGTNKQVNEGIISSERKVQRNFTPGLKQYRLNIAATIKLIELIGAKPILAIEERLVAANNTEEQKKTIQYNLSGVNNHEELVTLFNSCDSIIKQLSVDYSVPLINVNEKVGADSKYFMDHVHTTPEGSRVIAKEYSDFFINNIHLGHN